MFFSSSFSIKNTSYVIVILTVFTAAFLAVPTASLALTPAEQEAEWKKELAETEAEIAKWQSILNSTKKNTASLQQEAAILNAKIREAQAFIKKRNIAIAQLEADIKNKTATIADLEDQIEKGHESLAQLLRKTHEIDQTSLAEIILANRDISDFFSDLDTFQSIKRDLANMFVKIRDTKNLTEEEKITLAKRQDEQADQREAMAVEERKIKKDETQKQYLISVNKTQEKTYAQVLAEQQARAAEIRAKLFNLAGGSKAIPFGTALTYAQAASEKTGVDAAFVLAILTQESSLGANVGKCNLTDTTTGAGVNINTGKTWPNLMKPTRDVEPFLEITKKLGLDPMTTVVSCPIAGVAGYGGAMGPAQFIASTWKLIENRLQSVLGHEPNPWSPQDAFMASAMYLSDLGGVNGSYSAEMRAACKYYGSGGSSCSYGKSVQKLKESIQNDIDYLNEYGVSRR